MTRPEAVKWFPRNPHKYRGNPNNIWARSSWEKRAFIWADMNQSVIEWSSEEVIVPYLCETDNRLHRYFIDMYMKIRDSAGQVKTFLVEIKPFSQTMPPKFPGKNTPRYINEVQTFVKNQSKWKAARLYASERGSQFIILTEKELGIERK
jgi:hypothetical protein